MINLLQNALEAIGDSENGAIQVRCKAAPGGIALTVADNGPGIAADVREELFTPFNTSKEDGLGLGLAISRRSSPTMAGRSRSRAAPPERHLP